MYARVSLFFTVTAVFVGSHHFYQRFLHYKFEEEEILRQARVVVESSLCTSLGEGNGGGKFANCAGARETLNSPMPTANAFARAAEDWSLCGEKRCARLAEFVMDCVRPILFLVPFASIALFLACANWYFWGSQHRYYKARGLSVLDVGRDSGHMCLGAEGCDVQLYTSKLENLGGQSHTLKARSPSAVMATCKGVLGHRTPYVINE